MTKFESKNAHDSPVGLAVLQIMQQEQLLMLFDIWEIEAFLTPMKGV